MALFDQWCSSSWMIEQAKEELQNLEAQHPNRFGYLKLELQTFIISAETSEEINHHHQNIHSYNNHNNSINNASSSSLSVSTQASTSRKRKKNCSYHSQIQNFEANNNNNNNDLHHQCANKHKLRKRLDIYDGPAKTSSVDAAIERAEACLQKIRKMKDSFSSC